MPTMLVVALLAALGDPETPKGSCEEYVSSYRELLRERAEDERNPHPDRALPGAEAALARQDADRVFEAGRPRVEAACRKANRSEWECVVEAATYSDLASCRIAHLPLVPSATRVREALAELEASRPPQQTDPVSRMEAWISTGDLESSPELTRAAFEEQPPAKSETLAR